MNLYLLISALRARFRVFALAFLATVLLALLISLILPKKYVANASILVDARDEQSLNQALVSPRQQVGYLQTQVELIQSHTVAARVVRDLKLADNPAAKAEWESATGGEGSFEDWLADQLLRSLKVDTSSSSIVQIFFTANDPAFAAAVANGFAKAYMDTMLELRVQPTKQAAVWFDDQLKVLRGNLEAAYAKLSTYQRDKGIVGADERVDTENARLDALSSQLAQAQGQTYDARARAQQAREFLAEGVGADKIPDVIASPFIQGLKADLLRAEARLQELGTQYGRNYPAVQTQTDQVQGLRQRLDAEMRKIVDGLENSARQGTRREAELRDAVAAQRMRVLQMKSSRDQVAVLSRDVETAQRAYDAALQRSAVSKIESRANQTNVSILSPAIEPREAARPKVLLNVALAAVVGIMIGLGLVFLLETIDRRVRSYDDLYDAASVPVLAVLHSKTPASGGVAGLLPRRALPAPA